MRKTILLAALMLATPALASDLILGTMLGKTPDEVKTALTGMGYDVRKIEAEDGRIEAYVVKDKAMAEIYVDPVSGAVAKVEAK